MSKKCPKCGKSVYAAECLQSVGNWFHSGCFKCELCSRPLTQGKQKEREDRVYCELCFNKNFSVIGSGAAVSKPGSIGGDKCPVCNKAVYQAEEVKTQNYKYHPGCFVCHECKSHLTLGKQKEKESNVYCDLCFNKKFSIIGAGTAVAQPGSAGVGDKCPVCNKTVYQAEEVKTEKFKYHPSCFICSECKSHLTLGKQKEKEGNVYCDLCFNKKFSIIGAATAVAQPGSAGVGDKCPVCNKTVYQAEEVKTEKFKYHPSCFLCHECKSRLTLGKQKEKEGNVYCDLCFNKKFSIIGSGAAVAKPGTVGAGDKCPVCNKAVFQAEQVRTEISKYHPNCFVCNRCKSHLVLGKQREKDDNLYCENCYNYLFRIAGYGQITGLSSHVQSPAVKQDVLAAGDADGAGQGEATTAAAAETAVQADVEATAAQADVETSNVDGQVGLEDEREGEVGEETESS